MRGERESDRERKRELESWGGGGGGGWGGREKVLSQFTSKLSQTAPVV